MGWDRGRRGRWAAVGMAAACGWFFSGVQGHEDLEVRLAEIEARMAEHPREAGLYLERGELHREHEDFAAARADYARAREFDDDLPVLDLCAGRLEVEAGTPAAALAPLDRYLRAFPDDPTARTWRGRARAALGEPLAAAADFTAALDHPPAGRRPSPHLYLERARVLLAAGEERREDALRGLEEGIAALGAPVTLELEALQVEEALGRIDAAASRLDRLAASATRPEPWLVRKAELFERAGRPQVACRPYLEARRGLAALPAAQRQRGGLRRLGDEIDAALGRLPACMHAWGLTPDVHAVSGADGGGR